MKSFAAVLFAFVAVTVTAVAAHADVPPQLLDTSAISGRTFSGASGVLTINQSAGNGNAQANVTVIGKSRAPSVAQTAAGANVGSGRAEIRGFAFSGATGIVQLNQSAGNANTQANVVLLGDSTLANAVPKQSTLPIAPADGDDKNSVFASRHAFNDANGIVQVSQVAGSANRTSNTFVLQVQSVAGH